MNTPNALPVRIRKTFEDANYTNISLQTHANFRYTVSTPVNTEIDLDTNQQLERFEDVVIKTIGEMPESFMVMRRFLDGDKLSVKFRAVGYSASNEVVLGVSAKGDKVEQFITATINQIRSYFGEEPANEISTILSSANELRKQQEVMQTLAPAFGNAVASRMAQLLKQVLEEEAAKGIAPEDSAVIPGVAVGLLSPGAITGGAANSSTSNTTDDSVDDDDTDEPVDDDTSTVDDDVSTVYDNPLSVYFQDDEVVQDIPVPEKKSSRNRTRRTA